MLNYLREKQNTEPRSTVATVVLETYDYDFFSLDINREINKTNLERVRRSIKQNDMGMEYPILVTSDWRIKDGQHRFLARRELNLPIYYIVGCSEYDTDAIMLSNYATSQWRVKDYLMVKDSMGNTNANAILNDCERYGVHVNVFFDALGLRPKREDMINNRFQYTKELQNFAKTLFNELSIFENYPFSKHRKFIRAYKVLRQLNGYDLSAMKKAIKNYPALLTNQINQHMFLDNLVEVYNYNKIKKNRLEAKAGDINKLFTGMGN